MRREDWLKIERVCTRCFKKYNPTGACQRFCPACGIINEKETIRKYEHTKERIEQRHRYDRSEKAKVKYHRYQVKIRERARKRYYLIPENVRKARYYVHNAVRDKRLKKPMCCEKCGRKDWGIKRSMIESHHYMGYEPEYWLAVQWLCTDCHKEADAHE